MRFTLIVSLLLAVLAVLFALQNPDLMRVNFGPFEVEGSTALVLILTFALGALVGILAMVPGKVKSRKQVKSLHRHLSHQERRATPPPSQTAAAAPPGIPPDERDAGL